MKDGFVEILENKIPKKTKLARLIADVLRIEKESAYRRLRGVVQFSFNEAVLIAAKMNVSLDEVLLKPLPTSNVKKIMALPTIHPEITWNEENEETIDANINYLKDLVKQPFSEYGLAVKSIPFSLFSSYSLISRFYILKYFYHHGHPQNPVPFSKVYESQKQVIAREEFYNLYQRISNTFYVWDKKIISAIVEDIQYFKGIHLIKDNEVFELKKELHRFLNAMEHLSNEGKFKETGNKFDLYISNVDIDINYSYMWSEKMQLCMFNAFILFATSSHDEASVRTVSDWIQSIKRCSTRISGNENRERIMFFDRQRDIVNRL
ncbi:MAG: hypothetical protein LBH32_05650 [Dysgonamonadaceae bacterium]|jgi:hypothetical protein|nr:hypothetical protein [Dysgonamonadaceae bacterium]